MKVSAMKLISFSVSEFRSVMNSDPVEVGDVTCLVGKNEAGKTALLKALYRLAPVINEDSEFDATEDYPRKELGDYQHTVENAERQPATVICGTFELCADDIEEVGKVFGTKALKTPKLTLTKGYENTVEYTLDFDESAALTHVVKMANVSAEVRKTLKASQSWDELSVLLEGIEVSDEVTQLLQLVVKVAEGGGSHYAFNHILSERMPEFLYFDEYYQMKGHENVQALLQRREAKTLMPSDHPLIGLVNLARLKLEDLLNAQRTAVLKNSLEAAGNHLTRQVLKYWSQNKHLQMKFDIREGRPHDPEGMREGQNIWCEVYDKVHWATTKLGTRSKGFVWFFSFLAWYEDIKRGKGNLILLLDEPGLSLHGRAQADLLRYIEEQLKPHHQVIYSTHSPFMVDPHHFERVRIVQDRGIDADEPLPREEDGTKVLTEVFDATGDSLFPLQGALGYDIHQTLFVGPNCLVVEGPADMLYLQGISSVLERDDREGLSEKWTITPVGGSGKVPTFVSMLAPQQGLNIAVLIDLQAGDRQSIEALYKKKLLYKKKVHTFADFTGAAEADVEDMFDRDFYLELVNAEYQKQLKAPITADKLNANQPRVIKEIEAHLVVDPLKSGMFGHFRPARYFSENLEVLTPKLSDETKDRFEAAFKKLNELLQ